MSRGRRIPVLKLACSILLLAISQAALSQTVYTFTTAGAEGTTGPDQAAIDAAYSGTNLDGAVTSTGGIQTWDVPNTGVYMIEAFGAQGYGDFGGRGAHITGEFDLTAGTTLKILVGQKAPPFLNFPQTTYDKQFGGGGGSFVTLSDNTPLIVAGGGGGSHAGSFLAGADGQITEAGALGAQGGEVNWGGVNGQGGLEANSADGGAGLLGNGAGLAGGIAFVNGGAGGFDEGFGGFGGGGGTSSWNNYRGGGGGGYSGGGGAHNGATCCAAGGGGGSFNDGANPVNLAGVQLGDGVVKVTFKGLAFTKAFSPSLIEVGGVSTLTFTIENPQAVAATALDFTDNLPAGLAVATPANASTTCTGGTITAVSGSGTISYTGGSVGAGASCNVDVDVTAASVGEYINVSGDLTASPSGSSGTATATLTVVDAPNAPTITDVTAGDSQLTVAFTAGADNGSPITNYEYSLDGGSFVAFNPATTTSPVVIGDLTNGTSYAVQLRAVNGVGAGAASNSVDGTPVAVADAPTITAITAGDGQLTVAFTAGTDNGSPITNYEYSLDGGAFVAFNPAATSSPVVIRDLTNGTSYAVQLRAVNSVGAGAASNSVAGTPATVPGAPTDVIATPGNAEADVDWTAPADDGGSTITGYTVTSSPDNQFCTTTGVTGCTVPGLTNGTDYTFTVIASNDAGDSPPSSASSPVTPAGPPGAPLQVQVSPGVLSLTVSWVAPIDDGGSPILRYRAEANPTCEVDAQTDEVPGVTAYSCAITNLDPDRDYAVTVVAINAVGEGPGAAAAASARPLPPLPVPLFNRWGLMALILVMLALPMLVRRSTA